MFKQITLGTIGILIIACLFQHLVYTQVKINEKPQETIIKAEYEEDLSYLQMKLEHGIGGY